jgi:hypothetical protein
MFVAHTKTTQPARCPSVKTGKTAQSFVYVMRKLLMTFSPLAVVPSMTNCNPLGGSAADLWLSEMSDVKEKESPSAKGPVPNSSKKT